MHESIKRIKDSEQHVNSILVENQGYDPGQYAFAMPWNSDAACFNFKAPKISVRPDDLPEIVHDIPDLWTVVIMCPLPDYSCLKNLHNLKQLYIYGASDLSDISFIEDMMELDQLLISNSHIRTLESLVRLLKKKKVWLETCKKTLFELMKGWINQIFIESDVEPEGIEDVLVYRHQMEELIINGRPRIHQYRYGDDSDE